MFLGRAGDIDVYVCVGGCKNIVRLECVNDKSPLVEGVPGQSYYCSKCSEHYYYRKGRLMRSSEALRDAHNDAKKMQAEKVGG